MLSAIGYRLSAGFTLVELLVAVLIFMVVAGFLLANFRQGRSGDRVRAAADAFTADVERMQTLSLTGGFGSADVGASGYGVHVNRAEPSRYVLFVDRATPETAADRRWGTGEELPDGTIAVTTGVRVTVVAPADAVDVVFTSPRAAVIVTPDAAEARVTFASDDGRAARTVIVNRISGRVSVE